MAEFCTYITDLDSDPVAITRAEYEAQGGLPDDWVEYIWQDASDKSAAIAAHYQRHDEHMAAQSDMTVAEYIERG